MIRRQFLRGALGAAATLAFARAALAQSGGAHAMHGAMPDMHDMAGMDGMDHAPAAASQAPAPDLTLAAADALPAGAPLAPLRRLANESRVPGEFHATLVAQPVSRQLMRGTAPTPMWLYGSEGREGGDAAAGSVAGPLIELREGDTVRIRVINRLPQPTTIHWHGLPVPPDQDGNPLAMIEPGGTRTYAFTLPAGSAGTYWYHPHPHDYTAEQVFRGLAGPIVVRAADDPLAAWPERQLFVSDLKLATDGTIAPNDMMDWMNGREGQFVLLNGARRPRIALAQDERWRVWNASSARFLNLRFDDGRPFLHVGTDGGLIGRPRRVATLLLAPGERAELLVRAGDHAASAMLMADTYDRSKMAMAMSDDDDPMLPPDPPLPLADLSFAPAEARAVPATLRELRPLGRSVARKTVTFSEAMDMNAMMASAPGTRPAGMRFLVNGQSYAPHRATLTSRRGEVETWTIVNGTDMDHPFHLHGTQFQVLDREQGGKRTPEAYLAWRDTVNVRKGEVVRIATVQHDAGERMFHCHILEHEDLGMMGTLKVV